MKRISLALLILILSTSACTIGAQAPQDRNELATAAAQTVEAALLTPAASPTAAEATLAPQASPTTEIECQRSAAIETWTRDDVPYDKTEVDKLLAPGKSFVMSWELKNTGTCIWDDTYRMVFDSGDRITQNDSFPVMPKGYTVQPGEVLTINIQMTAPSEPGAYDSTFRLVDADGEHALIVGVLTNVGNPTNASLAAPGDLRYAYDCSTGVVKITLTWQDKANGEQGYRIYRDGAKLTDLPAGATTYEDIAPSSGSYLYLVAAFDAGGESATKVQAETTACQ